MRQLILGGAQFADSYGKFIPITKLPLEKLETLLQHSLEYGIQEIDLALNYLNADKNLASTRVAKSFSYSTKFSYQMGKEGEIIDLLLSQRELIGIESFSTIFVHNWFELSYRDQEAAKSLLEILVNMNLASKVGISVYEVDELENIESGITVIQAPLSFINRQFLSSEKAKSLNSVGVKFQARSIFHQGLLLNPSQEILEKFPEIQNFFEYCALNNLSFLQAALGVFDSQNLFSSLLIGTTHVNQIKQIVDTPILISDILERSSYLNFSADFSDPRRW